LNIEKLERKRIQIPELLAPVSSWDTLLAAIESGADAVYFGAGAFNARAFSKGPELQELSEWIDYCHLHSVKVYLTLNTILYEKELRAAFSFAEAAQKAHADAVILQDFGLLKLISSELPELSIHASTQMNLFDTEAFPWASQSGISRIVLPRELSLEEIHTRTEIGKNVQVESEVFVHGSLCMSYSGICYFSSMQSDGGRSGNRGSCAQPCRMAYQLSSKKEEFPIGRYLSPKDRSCISMLSELVETGVHSLKIEGRMKDAAYVEAVVRNYRECLDIIAKGEKEEREAIEKRDEELLLAFNRGGSFTQRHLTENDSDTFFSGDYPGKFGVLIGAVSGYVKNDGVLQIRPNKRKTLSKGAVLSIRRENIEICSFPVGKFGFENGEWVVKGLHFQFFDKLRRDDMVYQMTAGMSSKREKRKTPVHFILNSGEKENAYTYRISIEDGIHAGLFKSGTIFFEGNQDIPLISTERIVSQMKKMGDSPFFLQTFSCKEEGLPLPVSFINEIRREAIKGLEEVIHSSYETKNTVKEKSSESVPVFSPKSFCVEKHIHYYSLPLLSGELSENVDSYSFTPEDVLQEESFSRIVALSSMDTKASLWLFLPGAYNDTGKKNIDMAIQKMETTFSHRFLGIFSSFHRKGQKNIRLLPETNLANSVSVEKALENTCYSFSPSFDCKGELLSNWLFSLPLQAQASFIDILVYGKIPWMQTRISPLDAKNEDVFTLTSLGKDKSKVCGITSGTTQSTLLLGDYVSGADQSMMDALRYKNQSYCKMYMFLDEEKSMRTKIIEDR